MRLATVVIGVLCPFVGLGGGARDVSPGSGGFALQDALAFTQFPLFAAGEQMDGLPLSAVVRRDDSADYVSFVYGDCAPGASGGCAPPVEVQVWPACRRNLHLYDSGPPGMPVPERTTLRGVPAAFLDDGLRLELQASRSTIVVFGDSPARVRRVAEALREVGKPAPAGPLPAPVEGAVEGALSC
jgi:hypothetical protein